MNLLLLTLGILFLIVQISWFKINPFLAFVFTSIVAGILFGLPLNTIAPLVEKGLGEMLGAITLIIVFGSCIGKITVTSGAATSIAQTVMQYTGEKYLRLGMMITGFLVGIPLFYSVGFVLLVPLIFSVANQFQLPKVYVGIPMLASLSVAHGFLPPHPSPMTLTKMLQADLGLVLIYGFIIAIPTICIAGLYFSNFLKNITSVTTPSEFDIESKKNHENIPGFAVSLFSSLFPVFALTIMAIIPFITENKNIITICQTLAQPTIIMLISLLLCTYTLGIRRRKPLQEIMAEYADAIKDVALIIFILGGAGCLKEIMIASGVDQNIVAALQKTNIHPYFLAWAMAAIIRICVGSATAAGLMTASVLLPLLQFNSIDPNLLVLAIGAGSLMCSHVNDPGFWMFKEYFNISLKDTFKSWTVMESLVSALGIVFLFILNAIIH
ncbi:GntP family permease [Flavobacterium agrisoli]|uniref:TRAP transporter large permease subunit n=1 Tax=Flavobacterium agrisoli TaxID=2793066 RepID=A0A934UJQ0_9FLAO|nr:gluconate:H+ symporter [Flavobacterium agrisoli]MBK0369794.1 TRAP transporter large permease subunit [Flavobacterium agrisoli]